MVANKFSRSIYVAFCVPPDLLVRSHFNLSIEVLSSHTTTLKIKATCINTGI